MKAKKWTFHNEKKEVVLVLYRDSVNMDEFVKLMEFIKEIEKGKDGIIYTSETEMVEQPMHVPRIQENHKQ